MSADNWAECPRCLRVRKENDDAEQARIDAAYGKVSVAEFDAMRAVLAKAMQVPVEETFREDYEFSGVASGVLLISYSGSCRTCGLSLKFKREEVLDV